MAPYPSKRTGPGSWVILYDDQGTQYGYLWVSASGSIGYVASSSPGVGKRPDIQGALTTGSNTGKTARQVFDTWAAKKSGTVIAGPVMSGSLDLLPA